MPSLTYALALNRTEYVLSAGLELVALTLLCLPLYGQFWRRKWLAIKEGLAASLLLYQLAQVAFLLPSLVYNASMLFAWLFAMDVQKKPSVSTMFWTGLWTPAGTTAISSAMFFLTLDRCFVLIWPTYYPKRRAQRLVTVLASIVIIASYMAAAATTLTLELPLDEEKASYCLNHVCVATRFHYKFHVIGNTVQGLINLLLSIAFFVLLRQRTAADSGQQQNQQQQNAAFNKISATRNRIVCMTVMFELLLKIVPNLICYLVNNFTGLLISDYLGWYIMVLTSMDTFAVSVYYAVVLLKWRPITKGTASIFCRCFGLMNHDNTASNKGTQTQHQQQIQKQKIQHAKTVSLRAVSLPLHLHSQQQHSQQNQHRLSSTMEITRIE